MIGGCSAGCLGSLIWGRADLGGRPPYPEAVFQDLQEQGADILLIVQAHQRTLQRQICCQFQGKFTIQLVPLDHEVSPGCRITWTLCAQ